MKKSTLIVFTLMLFSIATFAQKNQIEHVWYNQEKTSKIQVYLAKDGKFYGKVVWLDKPNDEETGKPKLDKENPNDALKSTPIMGILILKGFSVDPEDKNVYTGGTVYDPKNGKTYCGKLTFKGKELDLRGFLCSASFLGRTSTWTLAE
ncbi:MAG TPA: DUF2147 domain-containing protein [Chitinophagales bacterium]|nr:DUF2147 domain-containing protein [Chitinophagales bacterium]